MQNYSEIEAHFVGPLPGERTLTSGAFLLFVSVTLVVLAFIPLVPPDNAIEGGGLTARGLIEFGLILAGLVLLGLYAKAKDLAAFDFRNPSFVLISLFVFWAVISSLWSPNPILTIAKGAELWAVMLAGVMFVSLARGQPGEKQHVETTLAVALIAVLGILILANLYLWGTPLPTTGDESLPLHLLEEEPLDLIARPRLILAYAHPLLTGDFLALSVICLFAARLSKLAKVLGITFLLGLLWMADARGPSIAIAAALIAMLWLQLKRNSVRAIVSMLVISLGLGIVLAFQNSLLKPISSVLPDDAYTLNSRTELWAKAFEYIGRQPLAGYGYYASRYLLMRDFSWAGHAHNSFIEALLTTGLVGLMLLVVYLAYLCRTIIATGNGLLLGAAIYTLIQGMLNPLFFTPGLPMFVLTIAALNATWNRSDRYLDKPVFAEGDWPERWEKRGETMRERPV
jgi:hypothetical protein